MPRAPKICSEVGCTALVYDRSKSKCEDHKRVGKWPDRYGTTRTAAAGHVKNRKAVLERDPYCKLRFAGICTIRSTHCDHIIPVSAGGSDDLSNLQGVCNPCHLRKTSYEGHAALGHTTPEDVQKPQKGKDYGGS
jgi:5-methylcytosine-specific restriction protein A